MNHDLLVIRLDTVSIEPDGCFGRIMNGKTEICKSLEKTFDELQGLPKIQAGEYRCTFSPFKGSGRSLIKYDAFEIHVPKMIGVFFHIANVEESLNGCIATGTGFGTFSLNKSGKIAKEGEDVVRTSKGVTASGAAFAMFMDYLKNDKEFILEVNGR